MNVDENIKYYIYIPQTKNKSTEKMRLLSRL